MEPKCVLVVGAGFMGAGIAQVCAQAGHRVYLNDIDSTVLKKAQEGIQWSVEKLSAKGFLQEPSQDVLNRLDYQTDLNSASMADWIIEAILEVEKLKLDLFTNLEKKISPETLLATNTSSIPITRMAAALDRPDRLVGLHFFGPVPFMGLVEVVKGQHTAPHVFQAGIDFIKSIGKTPVRVNRDIPGFVMNRIFSAAFKEAVDLVADGIVTPEDVDVGMRLGYGWNIGPFEIADNAGLDTFVLVGQSMAALGEEGLVTKSDLLLKMIDQGRLGKKVGKGFYNYTKDGKRILQD